MNRNLQTRRGSEPQSGELDSERFGSVEPLHQKTEFLHRPFQRVKFGAQDALVSSIQRQTRLSIIVADPPNLRRASAPGDREPSEQGLSIVSGGELNHATDWEPLSPPPSSRMSPQSSKPERESERENFQSSVGAVAGTEVVLLGGHVRARG